MKWVVREQVQGVSVILPYRVSPDIFPLYIHGLNICGKTYAKWDLAAQIM